MICGSLSPHLVVPLGEVVETLGVEGISCGEGAHNLPLPFSSVPFYFQATTNGMGSAKCSKHCVIFALFEAQSNGISQTQTKLSKTVS